MGVVLGAWSVVVAMAVRAYRRSPIGTGMSFPLAFSAGSGYMSPCFVGTSFKTIILLFLLLHSNYTDSSAWGAWQEEVRLEREQARLGLLCWFPRPRSQLQCFGRSRRSGSSWCSQIHTPL